MHKQAEVAIHTIGTNALPLALKWICYSEPAWKARLYAIIVKSPNAAAWPWMRARFDPHRNDRPDVIGELIFVILGRKATLAIPELTRLMNDPKKPEAAWRAMESLAYVGNADMPQLRESTLSYRSEPGCSQSGDEYVANDRGTKAADE